MTIPENANKVFFAGGDHSAVYDGSNMYKSKWGEGPLMRHPIGHCPYHATINYAYFNSYFVQHNGQFYYNSGNVPFMIGESRIFEPHLYYNHSALVYNWDVTTMKDDGPSVVGTIATITLLSGGQRASISFSQSGMYMIICRVTLYGQLHAEMRYEAIVN